MPNDILMLEHQILKIYLIFRKEAAWVIDKDIKSPLLKIESFAELRLSGKKMKMSEKKH